MLVYGVPKLNPFSAINWLLRRYMLLLNSLLSNNVHIYFMLDILYTNK